MITLQKDEQLGRAQWTGISFIGKDETGKTYFVKMQTYQETMQAKKQEYIQQGKSLEEAEVLAEQDMLLPGTISPEMPGVRQKKG